MQPTVGFLSASCIKKVTGIIKVGVASTGDVFLDFGKYARVPLIFGPIKIRKSTGPCFRQKPGSTIYGVSLLGQLKKGVLIPQGKLPFIFGPIKIYWTLFRPKLGSKYIYNDLV